ncbi:MAG: c-type cytochrome [Acidobacteriota bacterium]
MIAAFTAALYLGVLLCGRCIHGFNLFGSSAQAAHPMPWQPPSHDDIPPTALGQSIRRGRHLFEDTALFAPQYTGARVSCASCHAADGIQPWAMPMVGLPASFPMYSKRAGRMISLPDRIEECFVRSENGRPLPYDSQDMKSIVAYIAWLSASEPQNRPFRGRGLPLLPRMPSNPQRGAAVYAQQCAGCHGDEGQGIAPLYPPLWGPDSFNDGAGMNDVRKMASFVQRNMPQNRMGILTPQQAFDVAAFIHRQPRPHFNPAYARY